MADNVAITPGSGATVACDDISSVLYQRVKISEGADGSATDVGSANPLPTRVEGVTVSQTPTITAGAYSAEDAVGGLLTFAAAVRTTGKHGKLNTVVLKDKAFVKNVLELWLFDSDPTVAADNAAFTFTDGNIAKCVGIVPIAAANYYIAADNQIAIVQLTNFQFNCAATSLYGQLKCTGTPTYAGTTDLTVTLQIEYLD